MLLRFSVEKYKSFKDCATIDMVSSSKIRSMRMHMINRQGIKILRNAAIYGGNASGKTNFLNALSLMQHLVVIGIMPRLAGEEYCKLKGVGKNEPTTFDIQIEKNNKFYDYGFSIILNERKVVSEWLYELTFGNLDSRSRLIFQWDEKSGFTLPTDGMDSEDADRMSIYTDDHLAGFSALFLSSMNDGKRIEQGSALQVYKEIYEFFRDDLRILAASQPRAHSALYQDDESFQLVSRVLSSFDAGVNNVDKKEVTLEELRNRVSADAFHYFEDLLDEIANRRQTGAIALRLDGLFLGVENVASSNPRITELRFEHEGSDVDFGFSEESDGTRRLVDYVDLLLTANQNAVFIVDEINRSLHPLLTKHLISQFNHAHAEDNVQLIFTTHEDAIMQANLLRHDEVWFVERSDDGSSRLFPLDQFKERSDASIDKAYFLGRYGGIPFLKPLFSEVEIHSASIK